MKERISNLLDKEMDRKSFLIHAAAGVVALVGVSAAFRALGDGKSTHSAQAAKSSTRALGYGMTPYGR